MLKLQKQGACQGPHFVANRCYVQKCVSEETHFNHEDGEDGETDAVEN